MDQLSYYIMQMSYFSILVFKLRNPESSSFLGLPSYIADRMVLGHRLPDSFPILATRLAAQTETLTFRKTNRQKNPQK